MWNLQTTIGAKPILQVNEWSKIALFLYDFLLRKSPLTLSRSGSKVTILRIVPIYTSMILSK